MTPTIIVDPKNNVVTLGDSVITVDCTTFRNMYPDIDVVVSDGTKIWAERDPFNGREEDFDKSEYQRIVDKANEEVKKQQELEKTPVPRTLESAKSKKLREINDEYQYIMGSYLESYPDIETKTWSIQEEEARGYLKDATHPTPLLDKILEGRNGTTGTETIQQLSEAVVRNSDTFKSLQTYTGYRQRLEKQINTSTTISEVDAIVWGAN